MKRTIIALRRATALCVALFAWAIAAEMNFLPRLADVAWLRWQVCVLTGLVFLVSSERLSDLRCRCCGADEVLLRALCTRSHELLCRRCLRWNPVAEPAPARAPSSAVR